MKLPMQLAIALMYMHFHFHVHQAYALCALVPLHEHGVLAEWLVRPTKWGVPPAECQMPFPDRVLHTREHCVAWSQWTWTHAALRFFDDDAALRFCHDAALKFCDEYTVSGGSWGKCMVGGCRLFATVWGCTRPLGRCGATQGCGTCAHPKRCSIRTYNPTST